MRSIVRLAPLLLLAACVIPTPGLSTSSTRSTSSSDPPRASSPSGTPSATGPATGADPDAAFVGSGSTTQAGDTPDGEHATCDGAHDHCLPPGVVFATEWRGGAPGEAMVAMPIERGLWAWKRRDVIGGDIRGLTTERATSANLAVGKVVVVFRVNARPVDQLPRSESDAVAGDWVIGTVAAVDGALLHLDGVDAIAPIVAARVVTGAP